jgi:hypothetical protein
MIRSQWRDLERIREICKTPHLPICSTHVRRSIFTSPSPSLFYTALRTCRSDSPDVTSNTSVSALSHIVLNSASRSDAVRLSRTKSTFSVCECRLFQQATNFSSWAYIFGCLLLAWNVIPSCTRCFLRRPANDSCQPVGLVFCWRRLAVQIIDSASLVAIHMQIVVHVMNESKHLVQSCIGP